MANLMRHIIWNCKRLRTRSVTENITRKGENEDNWVKKILPESKMVRRVLSLATLVPENLTYIIRKEISISLPVNSMSVSTVHPDAKVYLNFSLKNLVQSLLKKKKGSGSPECETSTPPKKPKPKCLKKKPKKKCNTQLKTPCLDSSKKKKKTPPCIPPKSPCETKKKADPCKKNEDPCKEKKEDPCEKKEDPCKKKKEDPCKKKEDPCKKKEDPCKEKEDPCKEKEDPCKEKEDPCKKKEDPCKKKEDPCKKKEEDPCKKKEDPCKKKEDPCKKKEDPCKKKKADPCKKKKVDPCKKKKTDPCKKKKADPCKKKKEDPCKKKKADPCKKKKKKDPCANMTEIEQCDIQKGLACFMKKEFPVTKLLVLNSGNSLNLHSHFLRLHVRGMKQISHSSNFFRKEYKKISNVSNKVGMDIKRNTVSNGAIMDLSPKHIFSAMSYVYNLVHTSTNDLKWVSLKNYIMNIFQDQRSSSIKALKVNKPLSYERSLLNSLMTKFQKRSKRYSLDKNLTRDTKNTIQAPFNIVKRYSTKSKERSEVPNWCFNSIKIICYTDSSKCEPITLTINIVPCYSDEVDSPKQKLLNISKDFRPLSDYYSITLKHKDQLILANNFERKSNDPDVKSKNVKEGKNMKQSHWKDMAGQSLMEEQLDESFWKNLIGIKDIRAKMAPVLNNLFTIFLDFSHGLSVTRDTDTSKCKTLGKGEFSAIKSCREAVFQSQMDNKWNKTNREIYNECNDRIKYYNEFNSYKFKIRHNLITDLKDNRIVYGTDTSAVANQYFRCGSSNRECNGRLQHPDTNTSEEDTNGKILFSNEVLKTESNDCEKLTTELSLLEKIANKCLCCKTPLEPYLINVQTCKILNKMNDVPMDKAPFNPMDLELPSLESGGTDILVGNMLDFSLDLSSINYYVDDTKCQRKRDGTKRQTRPCRDGVVRSPMDEMWNADESYWPYYNECHRRTKHPDSYPPGEDPNANNMLFRTDVS